MRQHLFSLILVAAAGCSATAMADGWDSSGQFRLLQQNNQGNTEGPAAVANRLQPGLLSFDNSELSAEAEFRLSGHGLHGIATVHGQRPLNGTANPTGWINELYQDFGTDVWQFSVGKKIVSWDVGYGFRPNDMVQQEQRRMLVSSTLSGRPLALAEWFSADSALALVWVNPAEGRNSDSVREQALAARWYQRNGSLDLYGFARYGRDSHASIGSALAWVADESSEFHASWRYSEAQPSVTYAGTQTLAYSAPWQNSWNRHVQQLLLGFSYTTAAQDSYLVEYWWDGAAASQHEWRSWLQRNQLLQGLADNPALRYPTAANLAWQTGGLQSSGSLHRQNLYLRWSRSSGAWQTAADYLWTPEDRGHVASLSLGWQGDRWHFDGGLRHYGGPSNALYSQLPLGGSAYLAATWSF